MTQVKTLLAAVITFCAYQVCSAQISTVQTAHVAYETSSTDKSASLKKRFALLCNRYVQRFHKDKSVPVVYLVVGDSSDHVGGYELGYDNLPGFPSEYKYYGANKRLNKLGIRIKVPQDKVQTEHVLKLLEYGIKNLKELKKRRRIVKKAANGTHYNGISISSEKIKEILQEPPSDKVREVLNEVISMK